MLLKLKEKKGLQYIFIGVFAFLSSIFISLGDLMSYDIEIVQNMIETYSSTIWISFFSSGLYAAIFSILSLAIGSKIVEKFEIQDKRIEWKKPINILFIVLLLIVIPTLLISIDVTVDSLKIAGVRSIGFLLYNAFSSILYNGILEELWLRFGVLSFVIYGIYIVFEKDKTKRINRVYYILGVIITTLFIFNIQLYGALAFYSYHWLIVFRSFLNYLVLPFIFSYYYLNNGFKNAIKMHIIYVMSYVVFVPVVFELLNKIV